MHEVGGPARLQVIVMLAAVLGLDTADKGTLSAVTGQLKQTFHIGNTEIGLLLSVVSLIGAVATLPMGILADRTSRRRILLVAVLTWAAAMLISGFATSYLFLLLSRLCLGAVTAAAWPCVASLTGDFFPASDRARVYGLIIAGEMVGIGLGFFVSGEVSSLINWRWSFFVMALPALGLAWALWRFLPEPQRGAQSWLQLGETDASAAEEPHHSDHGGAKDAGGGEAAAAFKKVREHHIKPRRELILREDPLKRSIWWVMRYLLRLPTYRLLILASALAYYFFAGVRTFSMIYFSGHYHLARSTVSSLVFVFGVFALAGVIAGGRISQRLLARGQLSARITVPAVALFASVPLMGFGVWVSAPWIGVPTMALGACALAAAIAPIDAARLDIVMPSMWGRGEAGRMALRSLFEGGAPLLFGALSSWLGGGTVGLMRTFLLMLLPMLLASFLAIPARRSYPRDVATAAASVRAVKGS